jgi:NAD(P)H-hydrate epimerase
VLTPHEGELRRLLPSAAPDQSITDQAIRDWMRPFPSMQLVRKGNLTRVIDRERSVFIPHGGPVLARGGSGDLLAGLVAGRLANPILNTGQATWGGVALHSMAADRLATNRGEAHLTCCDLLDFLETC